MTTIRTVLAKGGAGLSKAAGHVLTSVVAAVCAAVVTNAVMQKDEHRPAPPMAVVTVVPQAPAKPVAATAPPVPSTPAAAFTLSGPVPGRADPAHAFPMDGAPHFQPSLSRPYAALAGNTWAAPAGEHAVLAAHERLQAPPRKAQPAVARQPRPTAPVETAAVPAAAPPNTPPASDPPAASPSLIGAHAQRLYAKVDQAVSGVTAAASNLTRLAGLF